MKLVLVPVAIVLFAATAQAAAAPRLEGAFAVKVTVVAGANLSDRKVGDVLSRSWSFTPTCASGACNVTLYRQSPLGGTIKVPMKFDGKAYTATESFVGNYTCKGVSYTGGERGPINWRVVVTKSKSIGGKLVATAISGTATERFAPTATVTAKGCTQAVTESDHLTGTRR